MSNEINPYESPPSEAEPSLIENTSPPDDTWKLVLLAAAILGGLFSFVPWLALIFAAISSPLFLRYSIACRRSKLTNQQTYGARATADVFGLIGVAMSILAAAAGAFLGTCTLVGWGTQFTGFAEAMAKLLYEDTYLADISVSITTGAFVGTFAFLVVFLWLWRRNRRYPFFDGES